VGLIPTGPASEHFYRSNWLCSWKKEAMKFIDDEREHHLVLAELGVLDDLEDYELYRAQENRFSELDEDVPYLEYVNTQHRQPHEPRSCKNGVGYARALW
jgi:hypothetical protein